jgi:cytochrome c-type biogenesis protein CcmH/NrfF
MFTYPVLLWFLPVLGVVILIHIINLRRHRRIEWAAMEFLLASYKRNKTRVILQQL